MDKKIRKFCKEIPKVELHAHLNGSLSKTCLQKLIDHHREHWPGELLLLDIDSIFDEKTFDGTFAFQLFPLLQKLTDNPVSVFMATKAVIKDFADENVRYLELRSTPRAVPGRMLKQEYVQAIIDVMLSSRKSNPSILVKLLISINRSESIENAIENIQLAETFHHKYPDIVVGIDLSGDPRVGRIAPVLALLEKVRSKSSLKFSLHVAEVPDQDEETEMILNFAPDRLGHGVYIHPKTGGSNVLMKLLTEKHIPVEVCLTSNYMSNFCEAVSSYEESHLIHLYNLNHPFSLGTDDRGIFHCTLSHEYEKAASLLHLDFNQLFELSMQSIKFLFCSEMEKATLEKEWENWWRLNFLSFEDKEY